VTEVDLVDYDVQAILAIVHVLKAQGLVIDQDFSFHYHPPKWDYFSNDAVYNRHTVFSFKDGAVASWFALKYGNNI
jgi:hypothetical protein